MADSCWYSKDITLSPGYLKGPKSFQDFSSSRLLRVKRSGCIDRQQIRSIDWKLFFFQLELFIFKRWWQLRMKTTTIKQRYRMQLFYFLPNSRSKLIRDQCTCICKLIIKTTAGYWYVHEQLRLCFIYVLVLYFVAYVLDIHLWKLSVLIGDLHDGVIWLQLP